MVEVKKLTKNYGNIKAVDNISFTVGEGEILGFLGTVSTDDTINITMSELEVYILVKHSLSELDRKILYCNHYLFLNIFCSDYIFNSAAKLQKKTEKD